MNAQSEMLSALASRRHGHTLPRKFYSDPAFYQADLDNIYYREWLFVGHDCELAEPGAYFTLQVGDYPIIVVRGRDGVDPRLQQFLPASRFPNLFGGARLGGQTGLPLSQLEL